MRNAALILLAVLCIAAGAAALGHPIAGSLVIVAVLLLYLRATWESWRVG